MEIPLFVLVLQIGFNAALTSRGYNGNPLIPSARYINSGQTRRLPESDGYQQLSSRGIPASDSEQSDDEYSSFEDYSFRSVRPLQSSPNQRRNDYLRFNNGPENDVSLESAPVGRINSNNYADSLQSSSSLSRRTDLDLRRPYLRYGPSNIRQGQTRKYYRKANDDFSLEVSSLESTDPEDASRLGEEASYLRSLLSLIEQPNNRRGQNRKYYRKANSLTPDVSPIDKLEPDEDAVNSLLSSPNWRRNYRKEYNDYLYDLRIHEPSPEKDIPDAYIDTILLVTDDDKPDEIPIGKPKLGSPESTGLGNNNLYNRRHGDGLNRDDDISNNLSPFRGLKPQLRSRKLANDRPLTRKFNRESNDNAGLESSLNDELFPDDDKTGQLTLLRLASLEDLHLESPLLRSSDRKNRNNRKSYRRNLRFSPNKKLTLDEGVVSELSDLLSETLDKLNLVPVTLRRTGPSNNKYSRRENNRLSAEEDNLKKLHVLRLGSVDIPNAELPLRRYHELVNRRNNRNLRQHGNNREALKKLFNDNPVKNLVPYHEVKGNKLPNSRRNEKLNNNRRDDFPDEFSLDTLFNFRKEDHNDRLDLDDSFLSDLSVLRSTNQDHLNLEPPLLRSSVNNPSKSKDTNGTLHLEFPWNGQLSHNKSITGGLRSQVALRNTKQKDSTKDTTDILHLEFPWNDPLSPNKNKADGLRPQTQLRSPEKKYDTKDTTDVLHLEFPWNDQLSPKKNKAGELRSQTQLRGPEQKDNTKDTTDILHLEFPWNDQLSPSKAKTSNLSAFRKLKLQLRRPEEKDITKDTNDTVHLEFPWNDQLNSDNDKISKLSALKSKSQLRNSKEKENAKDTTDTLLLEFPWKDKLSSDKNQTVEQKSLSLLKSQSDSRQDKDPKDELKLEFPGNDKPRPDKPSNKKTAVRTPDPFYVHPYLRNRNIKKHPNYFRRSYDEFTEGIRLQKLKDSPSESHLRHSNRRFNNNQSLGVLALAGEDLENYTVFRDTNEDPSVITFPLDRKSERLGTDAKGSQPLVTTTEIPNDTESVLNHIEDKNDRITYNDTITFPKN